MKTYLVATLVTLSACNWDRGAGDPYLDGGSGAVDSRAAVDNGPVDSGAEDAGAVDGPGTARPGSTYLQSVAVDPGGDLIVVGYLSMPVVAIGTPAPAAAPPTFVLARLGSDGAVRWTHDFRTGTADASVVAVDRDGNIVVAGTFHGDIDLGGGPMDGSTSFATHAFVASFTPQGGHRWSRAFGSARMAPPAPENNHGEDVVVGTDQIVTVGTLKDHHPLDFGGGELPPPAVPAHESYLAAYGLDGRHKWSRRFGARSGGLLALAHLAVDQDDSIVVAGSYQGQLDLGTEPSQGERGLVVARFTRDGVVSWARTFANPRAHGIALAGGDVVLTGVFSYDVIDLGTGPLPSRGYQDTFVARFAPNGTARWALQIGGSTRDDWTTPLDVAIDACGDIAITGGFGGSVDFRGEVRTSADSWWGDMFVATYGLAGALRRVRPYSSRESRYDPGRKHAASTDRGLVVVGGRDDPTVFGENLLVMFAGGAYVLRFPSTRLQPCSGPTP